MIKATSFVISNSVSKDGTQLVECQLFLPSVVEFINLPNGTQNTTESTESWYTKVYLPNGHTQQDVRNALVDLGELEPINEI
jgi:hypothetical protein